MFQKYGGQKDCLAEKIDRFTGFLPKPRVVNIVLNGHGHGCNFIHRRLEFSLESDRIVSDCQAKPYRKQRKYIYMKVRTWKSHRPHLKT